MAAEVARMTKVECPHCGKMVVVLGDGDRRCTFCDGMFHVEAKYVLQVESVTAIGKSDNPRESGGRVTNEKAGTSYSIRKRTTKKGEGGEIEGKWKPKGDGGGDMARSMSVFAPLVMKETDAGKPDRSIQVTADSQLAIARLRAALVDSSLVMMIEMKRYQVVSVTDCGATGYINLVEIIGKKESG